LLPNTLDYLADADKDGIPDEVEEKVEEATTAS
jgi:hypothetical protein